MKSAYRKMTKTETNFRPTDHNIFQHDSGTTDNVSGLIVVDFMWLTVTHTSTVARTVTVEGDFRFCWTITPNVGQTHKYNLNLVRILYMLCTLKHIYKQYNKLHEH